MPCLLTDAVGRGWDCGVFQLRACSGGGCAVGFLSAGNAQSVHNVLPPNTTVVIVKHTCANHPASMLEDSTP